MDELTLNLRRKFIHGTLQVDGRARERKEGHTDFWTNGPIDLKGEEGKKIIMVQHRHTDGQTKIRAQTDEKVSIRVAAKRQTDR